MNHYKFLPASRHTQGSLCLVCLSYKPGLILPSLSAGPSGTIEAIKIPRSSLPVLSSPTITKPEVGQTEVRKKHFSFLFFFTTFVNNVCLFKLQQTHQIPVSDPSLRSHRQSPSLVRSWLVCQLQKMFKWIECVIF